MYGWVLVTLFSKLEYCANIHTLDDFRKTNDNDDTLDFFYQNSGFEYIPGLDLNDALGAFQMRCQTVNIEPFKKFPTLRITGPGLPLNEDSVEESPCIPKEDRKINGKIRSKGFENSTNTKTLEQFDNNNSIGNTCDDSGKDCPLDSPVSAISQHSPHENSQKESAQKPDTCGNTHDKLRTDLCVDLPVSAMTDPHDLNLKDADTEISDHNETFFSTKEENIYISGDFNQCSNANSQSRKLTNVILPKLHEIKENKNNFHRKSSMKNERSVESEILNARTISKNPISVKTENLLAQSNNQGFKLEITTQSQRNMKPKIPSSDKIATIPGLRRNKSHRNLESVQIPNRFESKIHCRKTRLIYSPPLKTTSRTQELLANNLYDKKIESYQPRSKILSGSSSSGSEESELVSLPCAKITPSIQSSLLERVPQDNGGNFVPSTCSDFTFNKKAGQPDISRTPMPESIIQGEDFFLTNAQSESKNMESGPVNDHTSKYSHSSTPITDIFPVSDDDAQNRNENIFEFDIQTMHPSRSRENPEQAPSLRLEVGEPPLDPDPTQIQIRHSNQDGSNTRVDSEANIDISVSENSFPWTVFLLFVFSLVTMGYFMIKISSYEIMKKVRGLDKFFVLYTFLLTILFLNNSNLHQI